LEQLLLNQIQAFYCPPPSAAPHSWQDLRWLVMVWQKVSFAAYRWLKPHGGKKVSIRSVPDGDGINLAGGERVRYLGIDAPEIQAKGYAAQPYAIRARDFNKVLTTKHQVILFADGVSDRDEYGRWLRHAFVQEGYWVNAAMLLTGLAKPSHLDQQEKHLAVMLRHCGDQARKHHLGLWRHP